MSRKVEPSLRNLRIFAAVVKYESIHKAAEAVHLSQPAVSLVVKNLEAFVGTALFLRSNNGTEVTPAGRILDVRVSDLFDQMEAALGEFVPHSNKATLALVVERISRPHLAVLGAIAEGLQFEQAAKRVGVLKESFYRSLHDLERSIGATLVYHHPNCSSKQKESVLFARRLILAVREVGWAIEEINNLNTGDIGGQLRIGVRPLAGNYLLGPVVCDLKKASPLARIQVRTGDGPDLTKALLLGEIDFIVGLVRTFANDRGVVCEPLVSSPYVVVARSGHPLAKKRSVSTDDLAGYNWIAPLPGGSRRAAFDRLFRSSDRKAMADVETYSISTIWLLLTGSDCITLLTQYEYEFECDRGAEYLTTIPCSPIEPAETVGMIRRTRGDPTPLQMKFMDLMRQQGKLFSGMPPSEARRQLARRVQGGGQ